MQQQLPQNLNYNDIKPVGFPSHVRQEKYTPVAFNTSTSGVQSSDVIRFNISTNGFWDPYSAYIKLEVDVSQMDGNFSTTNGQSTGILQIDNSASSFISQLIISKGGTEIERIEEYDTIAAILNDMNSSNDNRSARYFEGMYSQNTPGNVQYNNPVNMCQPSNGASTGSSIVPYNYSPLVTQGQGPSNHIYNQYQQQSGSGPTFCNRYEFTLCHEDGKNTINPTNQTTFIYNNTLNTLNTPVSGTVQTYGFKTAFAQSLSAFGNESILSKNIYQQTTYKGQLGSLILVTKQTFCIPLISGLLGILMPKESYKYIPMKALQELILEFRLNPYAMFSSGLNDLSSTGNNQSTTSLSSTAQISRIWRLLKFEINVEVQYFEPQIENIILSQLNTDKGIVIHSQSWMLGPRYQLAANQSPNGTYQINLGFESLKNVIWVYIPDDFVSYTYCRKQYRISGLLTSMYIKVGSEYYPPLPITGHAGTCCGYTSNDNDANNTEFLISLYKTFGKFQDIQTNCIVNNVNFAVNSRAYNPANLSALSSGSTYTNLDTALSLPLFHENRCVGRAIYAMNLETLNQDYSVISGINTINNRPFEITLKADTGANVFSRTYTMYTFCNYDMLIQLRTSGVQILGRG